MDWFSQGLATFWIAVYLFPLRIFGGLIFTPLVFYVGIWEGSLIVALVTGVWATIMYFLLLKTDAFEKSLVTIGSFLEKHPTRVSKWILNKFFQGQHPEVSWLWLIAGFIGESPLTGTMVVRLFYDEKDWKKALVWIWVGTCVGVLIRFTPLYAGGLTLIKSMLHIFKWG